MIIKPSGGSSERAPTKPVSGPLAVFDWPPPPPAQQVADWPQSGRACSLLREAEKFKGARREHNLLLGRPFNVLLFFRFLFSISLVAHHWLLLFVQGSRRRGGHERERTRAKMEKNLAHLREGRTDRQTDRRTDGRTDGRTDSGGGALDWSAMRVRPSLEWAHSSRL